MPISIIFKKLGISKAFIPFIAIPYLFMISCSSSYENTSNEDKSVIKIRQHKSTKVTPKLLSPIDAYLSGKLKESPYTINGHRYVPISFKKAYHYNETGYASWYGKETLIKNKGQKTAYGERFDPSILSAAHKHLPLPMVVRVTNLENKKSLVLRVNDRGPFINNRLIDVSANAAKKLGFYENGIAKVRVESIYRKNKIDSELLKKDKTLLKVTERE